MPRIQPLRQPCSLLELCFHATGKYVYDVCCKIERQYGGYDQTVCATIVTTVQQYLLDYLYTLTDDVGMRVFKRHYYRSGLRDTRIMYALFMYKGMQSFTVLIGYCLGGLDVFYDFIVNKFYLLTSVTHLDLQGIVLTQEMLECIVKTCTLLKSLTVQMPGKYDGNKITDKEFALLSQLKHLRVLKDSSGSNFKYIDAKVILNLLLKIQELKEIDYINIGQVLEYYTEINKHCPSCRTLHNHQREINALHLTHIKLIASFTRKRDEQGELVLIDQDPRPDIILTIAETCPNLYHLELLNFEDSNELMRNQFLENMRTSSLHVSSLMMDGFILNDKFEQFLKDKGKYLKTFLLSPLQIVRSHIEVIQQLCPNVTHVKFASSNPNTGLSWVSNKFCIVGGI